MTRALRVVNLSNWDGEDYIIEDGPNKVRLRPGEATSLTLPHLDQAKATIEITTVDDEPLTPIYVESEGHEKKQTFPELHIGWQSNRIKHK